LINSLIMDNFQSHKNSEFLFDEGINIIVGQSDSGKTTIVRALNWVINNRPSGEAFRSSWGGETNVNLNLVSGWAVRRGKGKTNFYNLQNLTSVAGQGDEKFLSFGQDVPEEIKKFLNFSSLNIAWQFDSPFLLAMSGGEVAKYFNTIVHLDKIDSSILSINKTLRKEKELLEVCDKHIEGLEEREESFGYLDEAEEIADELEILDSDLFKIGTQQKFLSETLEEIKNCQKELEQYSDLDDLQKDINKIGKLLEKFNKVKEKQNELLRTLELITNIQTNLNWYEIELKKDQDKFNELMPDICPLCGRGEQNG